MDYKLKTSEIRIKELEKLVGEYIKKKHAEGRAVSKEIKENLRV